MPAQPAPYKLIQPVQHQTSVLFICPDHSDNVYVAQALPDKHTYMLTTEQRLLLELYGYHVQYNRPYDIGPIVYAWNGEQRLLLLGTDPIETWIAELKEHSR